MKFAFQAYVMANCHQHLSKKLQNSLMVTQDAKRKEDQR